MFKVKVVLYYNFPKSLKYKYELTDSQYELLDRTLIYAVNHKMIDYYIMETEL